MGDQFKSMYLEEAKTAEHGGIEGNLMCAPQGTKRLFALVYFARYSKSFQLPISV